jgi:hypothetical protein
MNAFRNRRLLKEQDVVVSEEDDVEVVVKGVTVKVGNLYPFRAPTIMYQGGEGIEYLKTKYKEHKPFLQYYSIDIPCIYCTTLTCSWVPTYRIGQLVDEWRGYMRIFQWLSAYEAVIPLTRFDDLVHQRILSYVFHDSSHTGQRYAYLS